MPVQTIQESNIPMKSGIGLNRNISIRRNFKKLTFQSISKFRKIQETNIPIN